MSRLGEEHERKSIIPKYLQHNALEIVPILNPTYLLVMDNNKIRRYLKPMREVGKCDVQNLKLDLSNSDEHSKEQAKRTRSYLSRLRPSVPGG
jgi:hypothetical protein